MAAEDAVTGVQVHLAFPDGERSVVEVDAPELVLGRRNPDAPGQVQVMDRLASRRHARVRLFEQGFTLEDMNSANGTLVGGQPIKQPISMAWGQPFQIGETTVRIVRPTDHSADTSDIPLDLSVRVDARALLEDLRRARDTGHGADPMGPRLLGIAEDLGRATLDAGDLASLAQRVSHLVRAQLDATRVRYLVERDGALFTLAEHGSEDGAHVSRTVCAWAFGRGESVWVANPGEDPRFAQAESIRGAPFAGSICCAPVLTREGATGALYATMVAGNRALTQDDLTVLTYAANLTALQAEKILLEADRLRKQCMERDMALAAEIQVAMLPQEAPVTERYEMHAWYEPSGEVSGDAFDFPLIAGQPAFLIADVSGKGPAAALLMAGLRTAVLALCDEGDLGRLGGRLNRIVKSLHAGAKFITAFLGVLEDEGRTLAYLNAGHCRPILLRRDGTCEELSTHDMPFGFHPGETYEVRRVALASGDQVLAYTDGLTESMNESREEFGRERTQAAFLRHAERPPIELLEAVAREAEAFRSGPLTDDTTMVLLRIA